jgi:hypothetical protein
MNTAMMSESKEMDEMLKYHVSSEEYRGVMDQVPLPLDGCSYGILHSADRKMKPWKHYNLSRRLATFQCVVTAGAADHENRSPEKEKKSSS